MSWENATYWSKCLYDSSREESGKETKKRQTLPMPHVSREEALREAKTPHMSLVPPGELL